jgi:hypothetical protein
LKPKTLTLWLVIAGFTAQGCTLDRETLSARADAVMWLIRPGGRLAGAQLRQDLSYPGLIESPELRGSLGLARHRLNLDWTPVALSGDAPGGFMFAG